MHFLATCGRIGIPKFCGNSENSAECFINAKRLLGKESEKMAYSALEVAKYVINHEHNEDRPITNLRLQKLLYFVQAKVLVETGEPCFEDEMEAWEYGPVVPIVYEAYKKYGNLPIIEEQQITEKIKASIQNNIGEILNYFGSTPTFGLVQITHGQTPWIEAKKHGLHSKISAESIKDFFTA